MLLGKSNEGEAQKHVGKIICKRDKYNEVDSKEIEVNLQTRFNRLRIGSSD
jgi:hypothetical protein